MEQGLYAQVVMLCRKDLKIVEANKNKMTLNSSSKVRLQDHSIGLIFILIGLKKNSTRETDFYWEIFQRHEKHKIQIHLKCLKFPSEIQNV